MCKAIIKKFKRYGTVENLMGRGLNCILPPRILRRMVREATKSPRITVKELQALEVSWGHQVSKSTIRHHLHNHKEKHLIPTVKFSGRSVMFWCHFNSRGPGALVRIDDIINSTEYQAILAENQVPSARRLGLGNKTMTQSIPQDPHRNGSVTTKSTFCNGHLSHQNSIQSKTCGLS